MKCIYFTCILCCVFTFSFAQFWTQKANFSGAARRSAMVFSIGTKAYLGMGYNGVFYKDLWEYDPVADSWNQKADFGGTARFAGVGFSISDKGYVGTGYDVNNTFNTADFWQYDPVANGWIQVADIPVARRYAVGFSLLGKGYVGTGANDTGYLNDFWQYDPVADSWIQKANFTGDPRYECAGFSVSDYGYIGLGAFAGTLYHDFYEYDPENDAWTQKADYPGGGPDAPMFLGSKEKGYVGGGSDQVNNFSDFWEWDQQSDTWTQLADFPGTPRPYGSGVLIINKAYMGIGGTQPYYNDWWEYTPDSSVATAVSAIAATQYFYVSALSGNNVVTAHYNLDKNAQLIIRNAVGSPVFSTSLKEGQNSKPISTADFRNGIYFYEVQDEKTILYSGKLVVVK